MRTQYKTKTFNLRATQCRFIGQTKDVNWSEFLRECIDRKINELLKEDFETTQRRQGKT